MRTSIANTITNNPQNGAVNPTTKMSKSRFIRSFAGIDVRRF
jgi:hypothetical protein